MRMPEPRSPGTSASSCDASVSIPGMRPSAIATPTNKVVTDLAIENEPCAVSRRLPLK